MHSDFKFSVIIPNHNRCDTLFEVLRALEGQTFALDRFEVIVVDDHSTDGSVEQLAQYLPNTALHFDWASSEGRGASSARNLGLRIARGERVLFLDADTIPSPEVLTMHDRLSEQYGRNICLLGKVTMSEAIRRREQGRLNDTATRYDNEPLYAVAWQEYRTANTSVSRELCLLAGGFDESLPAAEDTEFASRLAKLGVRFLFSGNIVVVHHHPLSADGFFRKGALYGKAAALWYRKSPEHRPLIVQRYGVLAPETGFYKKLKYALRALMVNRLTAPLISLIGKGLRRFWIEPSDELFVTVFRYNLRHAFRAHLKNSLVRESCGF